jgi:hypothetical protein
VSTWGWVITGYVVVLGALGVFVGRVLTRGRALARRVPDEDKLWL